ncbi:DUF4123 domain-containing protein [Sulfuriferula nivalis]|uniref:DUF4123 domain-containing protein n=1 Tax=Sulfuriferula nivalis TaxID=2675298 RepID=A0A809SCP9_9PROT|nr:DUF4123 domain-containing protein [Sulfuriferula nivalis]BBP00037.1 hypothetical protein SFSGTM_07450 [Sulfuriferula nivalis]
MAKPVLQQLSNQAALEALLVSLLQTESKEAMKPMQLFGLIDASQADILTSLLKDLAPYRINQQPPLNIYDDLEAPEMVAIGMRLISLQATSKAIAAACNAAFTSLSLSLLVSTSEHELATHLRQLREIVLPDGMRALFRYQDTRVATALMPLLKPEQAVSLLGAATAWFVPHVCGQAYGWQYADAHSQPKHTQLKLNDKQMTALDDALFVHTVEQQANETDTTLLAGKTPCAITTLLQQRITQGSAIGLKSKPDLALFAILSLQLPQGFETRPPFAEAIARVVKGLVSLPTALNQITTSQWQMLDNK